VRGQIGSSFFVGVLIAVALALLGVKYALLIGALAAVLNVVPFVGATIATVLATLSALNDGVVRAGITLPVMVLCQTIEGKLLAPYFVGRATGLHALAVLVALLAGFQLGGLVGGLVAVPFLAGAWEVVRTLWVEPRRSGAAGGGSLGAGARGARRNRARPRKSTMGCACRRAPIHSRIRRSTRNTGLARPRRAPRAPVPTGLFRGRLPATK